jgi:hypothetical protein
MQQNTALAMWGSTNDFSMFDFATYARCKRILHRKDVEIARLYYNLIHNTIQDATTYMLDVGSSDGSLLNTIVGQMNGQAHKHIVIDCVEPDKSGLPHLRQLHRAFEGYGITLRIVQSSIQNFLLYRRPLYNIIFCTHLFYHIPKDQWPMVIHSLLAALSTDGGRLFICLVSFDSDVYRVWDSIARTVESEGLPRRFDEDGQFIFAEDMCAFLMQEGIEATSHRIEATFRFSRHDCTEYRDKTARGIVETSFLMQFLAYMLRLHPRDLAHLYHKHNISALCKHDDLAFRSVDCVFEIQRTSE